MKKRQKIISIFLVALSFVCLVPSAGAYHDTLSGRIVLQVQENGEAWYIDPQNSKRYYLGRPADAFDIMRERGVGISNEDLAKIPQKDDLWNAPADILKYTQGRIVLQVEEHGEAWYINPVNGRRYYLGRPADAFTVMRELGLGITLDNLKKISLGDGPHEAASIPVPFISQAPTGDWSLPFGEACEETTLIMAEAYFNGDASIDASRARDRIYDLVDYQNARFGFYDDTSMADTAIIAQEKFGFQTKVEKEVTKEKIKQHIVNKQPIIFPVAGRNLNNPYYLGEGPPYHVVLIIGFEDDQFIVHDPGTRNGGSYRYHMDHMLRENHDLTVDQYDIKNGDRGMLVLSQ